MGIGKTTQLVSRKWKSGTEYKVGAVIIGTDDKLYVCYLDHTSSETNKPVSGASYTDYWTAWPEAPNTWQEEQGYEAGNIVYDGYMRICKEPHTSTVENRHSSAYWAGISKVKVKVTADKKIITTCRFPQKITLTFSGILEILGAYCHYDYDTSCDAPDWVNPNRAFVLTKTNDLNGYVRYACTDDYFSVEFTMRHVPYTDVSPYETDGRYVTIVLKRVKEGDANCHCVLFAVGKDIFISGKYSASAITIDSVFGVGDLGVSPNTYSMYRCKKAIPKGWSGFAEYTGALRWTVKNYTAGQSAVGSDGNVYICFANHTAAEINKPVSGENYTDYWVAWPAAGTCPAWQDGHEYSPGNLRTNPGDYISICKVAHTSSAGNESSGTYWAGVANYGASPWQEGVDCWAGGHTYGTDGEIYRCSSYHFSAANTRPITGEYWESYWAKQYWAYADRCTAVTCPDGFVHFCKATHLSAESNKCGGVHWYLAFKIIWNSVTQYYGGQSVLHNGMFYTAYVGSGNIGQEPKAEGRDCFWRKRADFNGIEGWLSGQIYGPDPAYIKGTDGKGYRCKNAFKLDEASIKNNRPTVGSNWETYWELAWESHLPETSEAWSDYWQILKCDLPFRDGIIFYNFPTLSIAHCGQCIVTPNETGFPHWEITIDYNVGNVVIGTDNRVYACEIAHTSTEDNCPVTGEHWDDYWVVAGCV